MCVGFQLLPALLKQVRASVVFALGTFISVTDRSDQANNIDLGVGMMLASVGNDGSPLVRKVGKLMTNFSI